MVILRVFPRRTSYTPDDPLVRIGPPGAWDVGLDVDEVHISVPFTWDMGEAGGNCCTHEGGKHMIFFLIALCGLVMVARIFYEKERNK